MEGGEEMSIKQKDQREGYFRDSISMPNPVLIEPHEVKMSACDIEEFANALIEKKKRASVVDYNKINYCISDLSDEKMFEDLNLLKWETLQMRLLKEKPMVNSEKVKIGLHFIDKYYKNYPTEFQEFIVRQQLQIPFTEEEIKERKKEFDYIIEKEEKENNK